MPEPFLPGATIGILGGGQLARMLALAAQPMGYHVVVLDPDPQCPAAAVCDRVIVSAFDDNDGLAQLADAVDVVTLEFDPVITSLIHHSILIVITWIASKVPR